MNLLHIDRRTRMYICDARYRCLVAWPASTATSALVSKSYILNRWFPVAKARHLPWQVARPSFHSSRRPRNREEAGVLDLSSYWSCRGTQPHHYVYRLLCTFAESQV